MKKIISISLLIALILSNGVFAASKVEEYSLNGQYQVGDVVTNDGVKYVCVEHNGTNQCNFGEDYEPGTGALWEDTWELYDSSTTTTTTTTTTDDEIANFDISKQPGKPTISNLSKTLQVSDYTLDWNIATSENPGKTLKVYENSTLIKTLTASVGEVYTSGKVQITGKKDGKYEYYLMLCNKSGLSDKCTKGNTVIMTITGVGKGTTTTTTTTTTTSTTGTSTSTSSSSIDRTKIPTFAELPRNTTFDEFGKTLEQKIRNDIRTNRMTTSQVKSYLDATQNWISELGKLNSKGQLTGKEKRSLIILRMVEKVLKKIA